MMSYSQTLLKKVSIVQNEQRSTVAKTIQYLTDPHKLSHQQVLFTALAGQCNKSILSKNIILTTILFTNYLAGNTRSAHFIYTIQTRQYTVLYLSFLSPTFELTFTKRKKNDCNYFSGQVLTDLRMANQKPISLKVFVQKYLHETLLKVKGQWHGIYYQLLPSD